MSEATAPGGFAPAAGFGRWLSDERLAKRATAGDEGAIAAIYGRYHQGLYCFCLAIVGNPHDAADALQSTMVKAMRALPGERRQIQLKPWLYRIAHNESIEILRRRLPCEPLDPDLVALTPSPAEGAEQRTRLRRLLIDLEELPERQRGVLVMRELAGLDFEEIGTTLGTSAAVARQTLYEARLSLRQMEEGRELNCDAVTRALSDADGRVTRRRDVRAHLRECQDCRLFREELRRRRADLAGLAPLSAAAAAAILNGIGGGGGGGAAVGAAGGAAAAGKAAGASALGAAGLAKSAATVAVVAAIGVTAADRGGLVDVGLSGGPPGAGSQALGGATPGALGAADRAEGSADRGGRPSGAAGRGSASGQAATTAVGAADARPARPGTGGAIPAPGDSIPPVDGGGPPDLGHGNGNQPAAGGHVAGADHQQDPGPARPGKPPHPEHPVHPEHPAHPHGSGGGGGGPPPWAPAGSKPDAAPTSAPGDGDQGEDDVPLAVASGEQGSQDDGQGQGQAKGQGSHDGQVLGE